MFKLVVDLLNGKLIDSFVEVKGWVRTRRDNGQIIFIELNDGSCLKNLQLVIHDPNITRDTINKLKTGSSIRSKGKLVASPVAGQPVELEVHEIEIYGESPSDYILQKKRHSFEFLREIAHLRPRTNTFGAMLRVRDSLSFAIHSFFREKGFRWVHTPIITANDAEGAGEIFQVTTLDLESLSKGNKLDYSQDFFGKKASLTVSGQLNGEALALAIGKIYTFGPTFRAENSNTSRHLSEFWMVEPEAAFYDLKDMINLAEEMLKYCVKFVLKSNEDDMHFFNQWIEKGLIEKLNLLLRSPFKTITYTEAVEILQPHQNEFQFSVEWGKELQAEHEKYLTEKIFNGPVVVIDYPKAFKAFYMKINEDGKTVKGMDVLVPRMGEIIGGSQREDNYEILIERMRELKIDPEEYSWYLDLRRYGSVPHSGFGLGLERFLQYITGISNIRDAIAFPRVPKSIRF